MQACVLRELPSGLRQGSKEVPILPKRHAIKVNTQSVFKRGVSLSLPEDLTKDES